MSDQNEYLEAILQAEMKYKKQVEESVKDRKNKIQEAKLAAEESIKKLQLTKEEEFKIFQKKKLEETKKEKERLEKEMDEVIAGVREKALKHQQEVVDTLLNIVVDVQIVRRDGTSE